MTEEEMKLNDELNAWGVYCEHVEDVSLARYREIVSAAKLNTDEAELRAVDAACIAVVQQIQGPPSADGGVGVPVLPVAKGRRR